MTIREISVFDLLSQEEKEDMMLELIEKGILEEFNEWKYARQEEYVLNYKKRKICDGCKDPSGHIFEYRAKKGRIDCFGLSLEKELEYFCEKCIMNILKEDPDSIGQIRRFSQ